MNKKSFTMAAMTLALAATLAGCGSNPSSTKATPQPIALAQAAGISGYDAGLVKLDKDQLVKLQGALQSQSGNRNSKEASTPPPAHEIVRGQAAGISGYDVEPIYATVGLSHYYGNSGKSFVLKFGQLDQDQLVKLQDLLQSQVDDKLIKSFNITNLSTTTTKIVKGRNVVGKLTVETVLLISK